MNSPFGKFRTAVNQAKKVQPFIGRLLALDPGETTGWSLFNAAQDDVQLLDAGQLKTWPMEDAVQNFTKHLNEHHPTRVIYEQYRVYEWKTDDHAWSQVPTLRIIGCLETLCIQKKIPFSHQTAQQAKNFCTDEKLEAWGYYIKGQKHARDSIRHGCYFLLFGPSKSS